MSSETKQPELKALVGWDRVAIGVAIMAARSSLALAFGLSLATLIPAYGLAEEPKVMQDTQAKIEVAEEGLQEEEKTGLLKMGWAKAKAGAAAVRDTVLDVDKREQDLRDDLNMARKELAEARAEAAAARYTAGVKQEMMLQCGNDLVAYLKSLSKD